MFDSVYILNTVEVKVQEVKDRMLSYKVLVGIILFQLVYSEEIQVRISPTFREREEKFVTALFFDVSVVQKLSKPSPEFLN